MQCCMLYLHSGIAPSSVQIDRYLEHLLHELLQLRSKEAEADLSLLLWVPWRRGGREGVVPPIDPVAVLPDLLAGERGGRREFSGGGRVEHGGFHRLLLLLLTPLAQLLQPACASHYHSMLCKLAGSIYELRATALQTFLRTILWHLAIASALLLCRRRYLVDDVLFLKGQPSQLLTLEASSFAL